jgi:hypothetical protein
MRIKRLQLSAAPGTIPDRGRLGGVIQASQRGRGAASAAEAPIRWLARRPLGMGYGFLLFLNVAPS